MDGEQDTLPGLGLDHFAVTTWDPDRRRAVWDCLCGERGEQLAGTHGAGWALARVLTAARAHLDVAAAATA